MSYQDTLQQQAYKKVNKCVRIPTDHSEGNLILHSNCNAFNIF